MKIYFDNAASTRPLKTVAEKMASKMLEQYANPASMSILGLEAEKEIIEAAKNIAFLLHADASEIYFTSGGTEGNNWAIYGTAQGYQRTGKHIVTTKIEHPAVAEPFKKLQEEGYEVTYLDTDKTGILSLENLKQAIRQDTILVSIILVNNETGAIQNIEEIGKIIKEKNNQTIFHVDGVQAFGKMEINVKQAHIDLMTASGHKFHAPKGLGFLYMKRGLKVRPLLYGGGQQKGMRPGTENSAGAMALALAAKECCKNWKESHTHVLSVKKKLAEGILSFIPDTKINGPSIEAASPYVLNVSFLGVRSEVLLHALEEKGIFVSAGSACNSKKKNQSAVLESMGLSQEKIDGAIRFSFSRFNTEEEAEYCVEILKELVPFLKKYHRK